MGFPGDSVVKNQPANAGDVGFDPSAKKSPREGNGNTDILAWEIPWTEEPSRLLSLGSQKSRTRVSD